MALAVTFLSHPVVTEHETAGSLVTVTKSESGCAAAWLGPQVTAAAATQETRVKMLSTACLFRNCRDV
jgi:hypothetical protein